VGHLSKQAFLGAITVQLHGSHFKATDTLYRPLLFKVQSSNITVCNFHKLLDWRVESRVSVICKMQLSAAHSPKRWYHIRLHCE